MSIWVLYLLKALVCEINCNQLAWCPVRQGSLIDLILIDNSLISYCSVLVPAKCGVKELCIQTLIRLAPTSLPFPHEKGKKGWTNEKRRLVTRTIAIICCHNMWGSHCILLAHPDVSANVWSDPILAGQTCNIPLLNFCIKNLNLLTISVSKPL